MVGPQLDVRNASEFQAVVDETIERHGRLDLLFNNAGISMGGETHDMDIGPAGTASSTSTSEASSTASRPHSPA